MGNLPFSCGEPVSPPPDTQSAAEDAAHADLIFTGGTIITMDDSNPTVEALAVKGENIMAVGTKDDIFKLKGLCTGVVELTRKETLMPGLIDPHTHPSLVAGISLFTDISGFKYRSFAEVKKVIKDAVHHTKPTLTDPHPWVLFQGWDPAIITDLPSLDAKTLDSLATAEYPVFVLNQALHSAWLNTKGLEVCGITSKTSDPPGGKIVRDSDGNPTGMLKEPPAVALPVAKIPKPGLLKWAKIAFDVLHQYSKNGFTTIIDMGTMPLDDKAALAFLSFITHCAECPVRMGLYYTPKTGKPSSHYENKKLWFPGAKIWADGSPYDGGMAVEKPFLQTQMTKALGFDFDHSPCGYLIYPSVDEQAKQLRPFQDELLATHTHGGRAIQQSLDVYEQLIQQNPGNSDHRYRLEHTGLITEEQLQRATQLGVTVTMFVGHVYYYGVALRDGILGPDRAERFAPTNLATTCGQKHWTIHEDATANPIAPFISMKACVTREMWKEPGHQLGPQYASTIDEALKAYTINAAWQLKRENDIGSLEVGKLADLVVLSENPKAIPPKKLPDIKVLETYIGGKHFDHRESNGTKCLIL